MSTITFNAPTTFNGNVEMFDNGSMKITGIEVNQVNVDIKNLPNFIEENLKYSPNKEAYLEMARILASSDDKAKILYADDKAKIRDAITKFLNMSKEFGKKFGKTVVVTGISTVTEKVFKAILKTLT